MFSFFFLSLNYISPTHLNIIFNIFSYTPFTHKHFCYNSLMHDNFALLFINVKKLLNLKLTGKWEELQKKEIATIEASVKLRLNTFKG